MSASQPQPQPQPLPQDEAAALRRALAADPGAAETWRQLAYRRFAADPAGAGIGFGRALALSPSAADWSNLAETRRVLRQAGATTAARRALAADPALPEAHNTQGAVLLQAQADGLPEEEPREEKGKGEGTRGRKGKGAAEEAAGSFARALALRADFPRAAYNRAAALAEQGAFAPAIALYDALLRRYPDFLEARWNRALALLASGRWREGWLAHESRRADPRLAPRVFTAPGGGRIPGWDGAPLAGRRLLLASEQGFGDTLQFLRYVPQAIALGARVVLDVPAPLRDLAATLPGLDHPPGHHLIVTGQALPEVDLEAPLMSLPLLLGPDRPPPPPPYLAADPARRAAWRRRLEESAGAFAGLPSIGIAWAGNPEQPNDRRRSIADADLAALAGGPVGGPGGGLRFVSLQKDRALPPVCRAAGWHDAAPDLADFAETAALIAELDLVIAVDTAVAHLAGALGRPVWVLLSSAADWRWPRGRRRSPWYPSARQVWRRPTETWRHTLARLAGHLAAAPFDPLGDPEAGNPEGAASA